MKKEKKSESITKELLFIKNSLVALNNENFENKKGLLEESTKKFEAVIQFFSGVKKLILFLSVAVLILTTLLVISVYYMDRAQNINNQIEDIRNDTIANQILEVRKIMLKDSTFKTSYNYRTKNNKIISYNQLLKKVDSLGYLDSIRVKKIESLENNVQISKEKIELAKIMYDIRFWNSTIKVNKKKIEYVNIESKKVDSALILLEVYRNKLKFNRETKRWEIK